MKTYTAKIQIKFLNVLGQKVKYITLNDIRDSKTNEVVLPFYNLTEAESQQLSRFKNGDEIIMWAYITTAMTQIINKNGERKEQFSTVLNLLLAV